MDVFALDLLRFQLKSADLDAELRTTRTSEAENFNLIHFADLQCVNVL